MASGSYSASPTASPSASGEPSPGIGLPTQREFTGPWLSQQLLLTLSFGLLSLLSFSILVKRRGWRDYLAPISRPDGNHKTTHDDDDDDNDDEEEHIAARTSKHEDFRLHDGGDTRVGRVLSAMGMEWLATTLYTSDIAAAHLSGPPTSSIDTLTLLDFFRFGTKLFAVLSLWAVFVLMPINWRENGWLDGVKPSEENGHRRGDHRKPQAGTTLAMLAIDLFKKKKHNDDDQPQPLPVTPGPPTFSDLAGTTLYDSTHLVTLYAITILFLWVLTKQTSFYLANRQKILHKLHSSLASRSILIRTLPPALRNPQALQEYFNSSLEMSAENAWVLPDVGMGVRRLLKERETALRNLEAAWVNWVGNPVKREFRPEWNPVAIEERIRKRSERIVAGLERLPTRGWIVSGSHPSSQQEGAIRLPVNNSDSESTPLVTPDAGVNDVVPPLDTDSSWGPPGLAHDRPTRRLGVFSSARVDLLGDLEVQFLKLDVALATVRKGMFEGRWKLIDVGFVEFKETKDALTAAQSLYHEQAGYCRTVMAPDARDIIWRNIGLPSSERRLRQMLVSVALTLLYLFYIPPLLFLGSLLSPAFLDKYIPGLYKLLSASPRLEALVSTSLPSLVLVGFNAGLPILLESTAIWQGVKTRSGVETSTLKKYHIFLVTSVIFIFFITGTAFGVLLDLSANPMAILDKLSLSLPGARNFSLSYVILQTFTILPFQLLSAATILLGPLYTLTAKTPREHAEAHPAAIFKAGTVYPQSLIIATLGLVYAIVKPLITVFAMLYFAIGYVIYKYKLLFVFYPPPTSMQSSLTAILRPRLIFAIVLFQIFQLSLFSAHRQVLLTLLTLPLIATTVWYGRFLDKRFSDLEKFEALEGSIAADRESRRRSVAQEQEQLQQQAAQEQSREAVGHQHERIGDSQSAPASPSPSPSDTDEATALWRNQPHYHNAQLGGAGGWTDGADLRTGTSTPSEYDASGQATPDVNASRPTTTAKAASQKRIWAPFARLKRNRSSRRGVAPDDDDGPSTTRRRRASQSRVIYHRPSSQYTNYREVTSEGGGGIEGLPGIVEGFSSADRGGTSSIFSISPSLPSGRRRGEARDARRDPVGRGRSGSDVVAGLSGPGTSPRRPTIGGVEGLLQRRNSHHGRGGRNRSYSAAALEEGRRGGTGEETPPPALIDVNDPANDEEADEDEEGEDGELDEEEAEREVAVETYEHPAIKGQLKQIWLPA